MKKKPVKIDDELLNIPILRIKKSVFKELPRNKRLRYEAFLIIKDNGQISVENNFLNIVPDVVVPGFEPKEKK